MYETEEGVFRDEKVRREQRERGGAVAKGRRGNRCDLLAETFLDPTESCSTQRKIQHAIIVLPTTSNHELYERLYISHSIIHVYVFTLSLVIWHMMMSS